MLTLPDDSLSAVQQYYELAKEYLDEGVPLDGLGIQGHTKDFVKPDPTAMWVSTLSTFQSARLVRVDDKTLLER